MTDHVQRGHEQDTPDATVVTLSQPMVDELGPQRTQELADGMARITAERLSDAEVDERLGALLRELGLEQPEVLVRNLADRLYQSTDITVVTNDGRVLHGDPSWSAQAIDPRVEGSEDPEDDSRPTYS